MVGGVYAIFWHGVCCRYVYFGYIGTLTGFRSKYRPYHTPMVTDGGGGTYTLTPSAFRRILRPNSEFCTTLFLLQLRNLLISHFPNFLSMIYEKRAFQMICLVLENLREQTTGAAFDLNTIFIISLQSHAS